MDGAIGGRIFIAETTRNDGCDGDGGFEEVHGSGALVGFTDATAKGIGAAVNNHSGTALLSEASRVCSCWDQSCGL